MRKVVNILIYILIGVSCSNDQGMVFTKFSDGTTAKYRMDENDLMQGVVKHYYADGRLKNEVVYVDNEKDGIEKEYYEDGSLHKTGGWIMGKEMGDFFEYDKKGKLLKHRFYTLNHEEGNGLIFIRDYDSKGNIIKEEGFIPSWMMFNRSSFTPNDTITALFYVSSFSDFYFTLSVYECSGNECKPIIVDEPFNNLHKDLLSKTKLLEEKNKFDKEFYWVNTIKMTDLKTNKITVETDTLWFNKNR